MTTGSDRPDASAEAPGPVSLNGEWLTVELPPGSEIELDLGVGRHEAAMWTCDLTYDYVRINAEYTT